MADTIPTPEFTMQDLLHELELFVLAIRENNEALASGLAEIAATVRPAKVGA